MSDVCRFAVKEVIRRIHTKTMRLRVRGQMWTHRKWNISGIQLFVLYKHTLKKEFRLSFCRGCFIHEIIYLSKNVLVQYLLHFILCLFSCCVSPIWSWGPETSPRRFLCNFFLFYIYSYFFIFCNYNVNYMLVICYQATCMKITLVRSAHYDGNAIYWTYYVHCLFYYAFNL